VRAAGTQLGDTPFFVLNGDSYFDVNLEELLGFHQAHRAGVSMALTAMMDANRYGTVRVSSNAAVTDFQEKRAGLRDGVVNAGVYVVDPSVVELIPENVPVSLEREILPRLVGHGLYGLLAHGFFIDIGVPADYLRLTNNPTCLLQLLEESETDDHTDPS
jgi:NDP-sugar pyrophosphorylase family protein